MEDYNNTRPHDALKGLTPQEAYTDPNKKLDLRQEVRKAKAARIAENRKVNCRVCS